MEPKFLFVSPALREKQNHPLCGWSFILVQLKIALCWNGFEAKTKKEGRGEEGAHL